jgi:hypothetical protein
MTTPTPTTRPAPLGVRVPPVGDPTARRLLALYPEVIGADHPLAFAFAMPREAHRVTIDTATVGRLLGYGYPGELWLLTERPALAIGCTDLPLDWWLDLSTEAPMLPGSEPDQLRDIIVANAFPPIDWPCHTVDSPTRGPDEMCAHCRTLFEETFLLGPSARLALIQSAERDPWRHCERRNAEIERLLARVEYALWQVADAVTAITGWQPGTARPERLERTAAELREQRLTVPPVPPVPSTAKWEPF